MTWQKSALWQSISKDKEEEKAVAKGFRAYRSA